MSAPLRCGSCHGGPCLFDAPPALLCGEGGATVHHAPASLVVEYVVDESGRRDFDNGDVRVERLYSCSHPSCVGSAEQHAHDAGSWISTEPITVSDIEDATGLDLTGHLAEAVA